MRSAGEKSTLHLSRSAGRRTTLSIQFHTRKFEQKMPAMKRLISFFPILFAFQLVFTCDCISRTVKESYDRSDLVVKGIVISTKEITRNVTQSYIDSFQKTRDQLYYKDAVILEYEIKVNKTYKGVITSDTIKVRTFRPSNCHLKLKEGGMYILYAYSIEHLDETFDFNVNGNTFSSNACTSTEQYNIQHNSQLNKVINENE